MDEKKYKTNIGHVDKWARVAGGAAIIAIGLYYESWLGLIGFIPIVVAFVGWCPVYALLGFDSCPADRKMKCQRFSDEYRNMK
ncbi:MAG: DUF2892 domain-containing protein [Elusimicrobiaceae bacterium]|jgi:hypothetical protein